MKAEANSRDLSFWHDSLPDALEARPSLQGETRCDVAIVGAGYTGLWTEFTRSGIEGFRGDNNSNSPGPEPIVRLITTQWH